MSTFKDPDNFEEILETLKETPTLEGVLQLIDKCFPNWIIAFLDRFCDDYPHLQDNWEKLCMMIDEEMKTTQILIVEDITFDDDHKLQKLFCELFTRTGFCVKRKVEFIPCPICNKAIPTEWYYDIIKTGKFEIPDVYSDKCSNCICLE